MGLETLTDSGLVSLGGKPFDTTTGNWMIPDAGQGKGLSKGLNPPKPRPRVIIIIGAPNPGEDSSPGARIGWEDDYKLAFYYFQKLVAAGYDVTIMCNPSADEVKARLADDNVVGVVFIGHGAYGLGALRNGGHFDPKLVSGGRKNRGKLRFVVLESCYGWNDGKISHAPTVTDWLKVCDEFTAYSGTTDQADRLKHLNPKDDSDPFLPGWKPPHIIRAPSWIPRYPLNRPWVPGWGMIQ